MKIIVTETSIYMLDDERLLIRRLPGGTPWEENGSVALAQLRRDGEEIPVVRILQLVVGQPMHLLLDLRGDGVLTHRTSTLVREIRDAEEVL